jgi:sugar phosphate isomerase/epimerase
MTRVIGLEHLTLLGVAPPRLAAIAAAAGFTAIGLRISPVTDGEQGWPMAPGSPMLTQTALACAAAGLEVLDVEGIRLGPAPDLAAAETILDAAAVLGARFVNIICEDPDLARLADSFGAVTRLARARGVRPVIEFMAYRTVRTLAAAVAIVSGSGGGGILIDALHVQRCGVVLSELAAVDPALIAYLQLCDAPLAAPADQVSEARTGRLLPGDGELPLRQLLAVLPDGIPVAAEVPRQRRDTTPAECAQQARQALDAVLEGEGHL